MKALLYLLAFVFTSPLNAQNAEELELERKDCTLRGTLTTSSDSIKSRTLIMIIAGSGPTDRDGNNANMKNNALKMLSDKLVENGYATFRYDKRAIGASKMPLSFDQKDLSFDDFIADADALVSKLSSTKRFDKIILTGHSQGMQGLVNAKLDTLAMGDTLKYSPKILHSLMHPSIQPFLISWMKYDPAKEITELKQPVLLINGTYDVQVAVNEMELLAASNEKATTKKIGKMNHILKWINTKDMGYQIEQYSEPDVPLHKKLMKPILKFITKV
jgi:pimeloyl-ACP methyl ester carboxylesterase